MKPWLVLLASCAACASPGYVEREAISGFEVTDAVPLPW